MCVCVSQYATSALLLPLAQRLEHLEFLVPSDLSILIEAPDSDSELAHSTALREVLPALHSLRARRTSNKAELSVILRGFAFTSGLTAELSGLPALNAPVTLRIEDRPTVHTELREEEWEENITESAHEEASYKLLGSRLPPCYTHVQLTGEHVRLWHIIELCQGAAQRSEGQSRLKVSVVYKPVYSNRGGGPALSDVGRTRVEKWVDEKGLGRAVELHWCEVPEDTV